MKQSNVSAMDKSCINATREICMKQNNVSAMGQNTYISLVPVYACGHRHKVKHKRSRNVIL